MQTIERQNVGPTENLIGAELLNLLSKNLYPSPKDSIREYIQNSIDAKALEVSIHIDTKKKEIYIEDDGFGMDRQGLEKSIKIAISEKHTQEQVGYKGIGIYSGLHLADDLQIKTRAKGSDLCYTLKMELKNIRSRIEQKKSIENILDSCIKIEEQNSDFAKGTTIIFSNTIIDLDDFADGIKNYLQKSVSIKMADNFTDSQSVEKKIEEVANKQKQPYHTTTLSIDINGHIEKIERPYDSSDLNKAIFIPIKDHENFYGLAWGCLNSNRKKISSTRHRGFLLKKHGFTIGDDNTIKKYFPSGSKFFDRYLGEFIILNSKLEPDISRTEIQSWDKLGTQFKKALRQATKQFEEIANDYQEYNIAEEELTKYLKTNRTPEGQQVEEYGYRLNKINIILEKLENKDADDPWSLYFMQFKKIINNLITKFPTTDSIKKKSKKSKKNDDLILNKLSELSEAKIIDVEKLDKVKLIDLYASIQKLKTAKETNTKIIIIWAFFENLGDLYNSTVNSKSARKEGISVFLDSSKNNDLLNKAYEGDDIRHARDQLNEIKDTGNRIKHRYKCTASGNKDWEHKVDQLKELIVKTIDEIKTIDEVKR